MHKKSKARARVGLKHGCLLPSHADTGLPVLVNDSAVGYDFSVRHSAVNRYCG